MVDDEASGGVLAGDPTRASPLNESAFGSAASDEQREGGAMGPRRTKSQWNWCGARAPHECDAGTRGVKSCRAGPPTKRGPLSSQTRIVLKKAPCETSHDDVEAWEQRRRSRGSRSRHNKDNSSKVPPRTGRPGAYRVAPGGRPRGVDDDAPPIEAAQSAVPVRTAFPPTLPEHTSPASRATPDAMLLEATRVVAEPERPDLTVLGADAVISGSNACSTYATSRDAFGRRSPFEHSHSSVWQWAYRWN
jgi:hypothetical protein